MTTVDTDTIIQDTIQSIKQHHTTNNQSIPYITLTYAQSINGSISNLNKSQLKLSGVQSKLFTHQLRNIHDGILVGIGTIINDNPILTTRLNNTTTTVHSPHPIIIDTQCKLYDIYMNYRIISRKPTIVTVLSQDNHKVIKLKSLGCIVITALYDTTYTQYINLYDVLIQLYSLNYNSIMIEGGSSIITSMLTQYTQYINQVIITFAPLYITGLNVINNQHSINQSLCNIKYCSAGNDLIIQGNIQLKQDTIQ